MSANKQVVLYSMGRTVKNGIDMGGQQSLSTVCPKELNIIHLSYNGK